MKKLILTSAMALISYFGYCQTKADTAKKSQPVISSTAFRVRFDDVFKTNTDGSISPKYQTQVGSAIMGPGVSMGGGVQIGGIDFYKYRGHDLSVDTLNHVVIIRGVY